MNIIISNSGGLPIYEQIVNQIKSQILTGELTAGFPLPSMRNLAKELHISVITTKRAYEELEREGLIKSYTGKGSFVSEQDREGLKELHLCEIERQLEDVVGLAKNSGVQENELIEIIKLLYKGDE